MSSGVPIEMYWDSTNRALRPVNAAWTKRAEQRWAAGEIYHITEQEARSTASHNHYFASVESAWKNLPEILAERFPSSDHLRKYALIRTGWHNSHVVTCGTRADAMRVAALARSLDEFAVVDIPPAGSVVTVYTAQSQSTRMGKDDFQSSKDDVLSFLASMIGVKTEDLRQARSA
jgi:hypothetical protein